MRLICYILYNITVYYSHLNAGAISENDLANDLPCAGEVIRGTLRADDAYYLNGFATKGKEPDMKRVRLLITVMILALISGVLAGCGGPATGGETEPGETPDENTEEQAMEKPKVEITMQDGGKIVIELDPGAAPKTVENFLKLVGEGFYDGLTFHRIIPGFMIQGGDPQGTGTGGSDENIPGEFSSNGVDNPIKHVRGVISMARSGNDYNSASSQFFITSADVPHLDGDYAAFGHVTEGMEVVDQISAVETTGPSANPADAPLTPVVIESIKEIK
jgi:peptidyl-prolyl cis-trans isomerase B (cyclophilin B)